MTPQPRRNGLPPQPLQGWCRESFSGEMNRNAKFQKADVERICLLHAKGMSCTDIAEVFNVSKDCVSKIVRGLRYGNETREVRAKIMEAALVSIKEAMQ